MTTPDPQQGHPPGNAQNQPQAPDPVVAQPAQHRLYDGQQVLQGRAPDATQEQMNQATAEQWRKVGNEAPVQAITRIEEAAKQLIGLNAALQGLYVAVFAFSDLRKQVEAIHLFIPGSLILLIYFIPMLFWLISLYCATQVFVPKVRPGVDLNDMSVTAWQDIKHTYETTVAEKLAWLHRSHRWLIVSFSVLLLVLVLLVFLPAAPQPGPMPTP